ncbi:SDR family NAD(P)-dependent oxidoreductase [Acinetobacter sichuanensis]|uniref:SDR family NAD(P)-dependent oxidoreductase n=1 Tax=Acinetobacter sichuanensis TaxID=2136183 RepID=A0A371YR56_9GAMM|nr:SDR family NAD(P)-dependent oxidoreductase [Acinetobacter sichuanensis]RFC83948.1 SDR family NAD(P)-dependent oxidoreductase [Acinetobacter sichuanensis]
MVDTKLQSTVLILGASRGIGLGLVKQYLERGWQVIATERTLAPDTNLALLKQNFEAQLSIYQLDINQSDDLKKLSEKLDDISLDILLVNAGVSDDPQQTVGQISTDEFTHLMLTNALSPLRAIENLAHLVKKQGSIAVMSSALGSVSLNTEGGFEVYRASKAALNMLLRSYAARAGSQHSIFALMPGWVQTDMGGSNAPVSVQESTSGLVNTIEQHVGQAGIYFVDYQNQPIAW